MLSEITQIRAKELLQYDAESGVFTWKVSRGGVRAGSIAGTICRNGYAAIKIDDVNRLCHRLAWLYMFGVWPDGHIDHADRNKTNNRIANLRIATISQNQQNRLIQANNTSGFRGVVWNKSMKKWPSSIMLNKKRTQIGLFETAEDAYAAYLSFAAHMHTHNPYAAPA